MSSDSCHCQIDLQKLYKPFKSVSEANNLRVNLAYLLGKQQFETKTLPWKKKGTTRMPAYLKKELSVFQFIETAVWPIGFPDIYSEGNQNLELLLKRQSHLVHYLC